RVADESTRLPLRGGGSRGRRGSHRDRAQRGKAGRAHTADEDGAGDPDRRSHRLRGNRSLGDGSALNQHQRRPAGATDQKDTMRRFGFSGAAMLSALLTLGATAHAEVEEGSNNVPPVSGQPMGKVAVRRGVQGPGGLFTARVLLLVNASKDNFGKPTSLAPDLYYSVSDTVQIGLLHTGPMGWQSRPGFGLCLTGTANGCPRVYDNVGLDFMYGLLFGDFHLSLHSSLFLLPISDPTGVMWTIGLTGKFHFTDVVALYFDPQVGVILSNRDAHKDQLFIPLELQFQVTAA